jgi:hypothetical protein
MTPIVTGGGDPYGQDMNGILYAITANLSALTGGQLYQYNVTWATANSGYALGAVLQQAANPVGMWVNLLSGNTANPDTGGANWLAYPPYSVKTPAEIAAGVTPVNYAYPPLWVDRYGNNTTPGTTDMTAAINAALAVAGQAVGTSQGAAIYFINSTYLISSTITGPNRVRFIGMNKRGTVILASAAWNNATYPQMFQFVGGTWSGGTYTPAAG